MILPLQKLAKEKVYNFSLDYYLSENIVAYIPEESEDLIIRIENYLTGQYFDVIEDDLCPAPSSAECIYLSYFNDDQFVLEWSGSKWVNEKENDLRKKGFSIKFE